jgi:hypothetical protein
MEIIIKNTGQVVSEKQFRNLFPNTSFPVYLSKELLNDFGADVILQGVQPIPTKYQIVYRDGYEQINNQWFTKYAIENMNAEAIKNADANQASAVRQNRNEKLTASDWTQLEDSPVNKAAWAVYRQELRDITTQQGFPWEIIWPEEP